MCSASLVVSGEWEWAFSDVAVGPSHPRVLPDSPGAGHLSQERLAAGQVHSLHQRHSLCFSWRRHRENFTGSVFLTSTFLIEVLGFVCVLLCLPSIISLGNDWTELAVLAELHMNSLYCRGWYSSKTFLHHLPIAFSWMECSWNVVGMDFHGAAAYSGWLHSPPQELHVLIIKTDTLKQSAGPVWRVGLPVTDLRECWGGENFVG